MCNQGFNNSFFNGDFDRDDRDDRCDRDERCDRDDRDDRCDRDDRRDRDDRCDRDERRDRFPTHTHGFIGNTGNNLGHNHGFFGVTGRAIPCGRSHVHKLYINTESFNGHFHEICDTTGPAIYIGNGKHIHRVSGCTQRTLGAARNHAHRYNFATLVDNPSGCEERP